jgi:hypothetical protein
MALPFGLGSCKGGRQCVNGMGIATDEYSEVRVSAMWSRRKYVVNEAPNANVVRASCNSCKVGGGVDPLFDGCELWQNEELDSFMKEFKLN